MAVAVAVTTGVGRRRVVVGVRDGGDGGAVGVATLTEIEVIVGVLAGHPWPGRLGSTGHSYLTAADITVVDVVVQVVVLVLDDWLLDDGRRIAEALMLAVAVMVAGGADNTQRRAGRASTIVAGVARSDRGEAVRINA